MNILILGKGGREHALIRAMCLSPDTHQIFVWPGREGFEPQAVCITQPLEKESMKKWVKDNNIKMVIIGPEKELAEGWSDFFRSLGLLVFGPSQKAAQLESSKLFAKHFMASSGIPTSEFMEVHSVKSALATQARFDFPIVLKADGLAGGKGVFIIHNKQELEKYASLLFEEKVFGKAGGKALLETFQKGTELSVFALTNGESYILLPFAKDYKKLKEKNQGSNTGGMGAFAPYTISSDLQKNIEETIVRPTIKGIKNKHLFYRGILYIGLIIVNKKPFVLEYNVRFGDPEAQVLLPLLEGDWVEVFQSVAKGKLPPLKWRKDCFTACVVLASEGYPSQPAVGKSVQGNIDYEIKGHSYFLHAGTKKSAAPTSDWVTDGGRVLNAIGVGKSKAEAVQRAYTQVSFVHWPGMQMRQDIGAEA